MPVKISEFTAEPLAEHSQYVRTYRLRYSQNGKKRIWDGILSQNSVSVLIYHAEKRCFLFVRQFRPVVYYAELRESVGLNAHDDITNIVSEKSLPVTAGEVLELCAGLIDSTDSNPKQAATREILEECGYQVDEPSLVWINSFRGNVGLIGNQMELYYAQVVESQRVPGAGGGLVEEGECIDLVEWPLSKLDELLTADHNRPPSPVSFSYALLWFKFNILPHLL
ncbi:unnamed protein product [Calicophoron daubneyi]|uniref:Uridine diphosphate glucose pyrophosphatase NUDT14 n=1 Tax=Calicophoron daubneyi TaxID=300641 RepID=A0AAV2TW85_CALDB